MWVPSYTLLRFMTIKGGAKTLLACLSLAWPHRGNLIAHSCITIAEVGIGGGGWGVVCIAQCKKKSLYCFSCLLKWKSDAGRHVLHAVFPVLPINGFEMKIQTICMSQNLHLKKCDKLKVSLHSLIIGFQGQWADLSDNGQEWATKDRLNQQTFNHQLQCMQGHMLFIQNLKLFWRRQQ